MLTKNQRFVIEPLSELLEKYISTAQPAISPSIKAFPCSATLTDSSTIDTFIISEKEFRRYFRTGPTNLKTHDLSEILLTSSEISSVHSCKNLCNKSLIENIYKIKNDIRPLGYGHIFHFKLLFKDNSSQAYYSEHPDLLDFLTLPKGKSYKDVLSVQKSNPSIINGYKNYKFISMNNLIIYKIK